MENILIFDSETTGLPPKGAKYETDYLQFPHIVQLAWVFNGIYKDHIIKPEGYEIPKEATAIHGITTEMATEKGQSFKSVIDEFIDDCFVAKKIVGHNIYFDTSIIKANILRSEVPAFFFDKADIALDKEKRICTMMRTIKFVNAKYPDGRGGKFPKLEELYLKLFNETFPAHNALEDVKATERCFNELVNLKIIELDGIN